MTNTGCLLTEMSKPVNSPPTLFTGMTTASETKSLVHGQKRSRNIIKKY